MPVSPKKAVIAGCARDCAVHLPHVFACIESLSGLFSECAIVIVENDSKDGTKQALQGFRDRVENCHILNLDGLAAQETARTRRIAAARNGYLDFIDANALRTFDYLIACDLDDVNTNIDPPSLARAAQYLDASPNHAGVFPNQIGVYYDMWALRHPTACPDDVWAEVLEYGVVHQVPDEAAYSATFRKRIFSIPVTVAPIEVNSAFGGLGIYKLEYALKSRYYGEQTRSIKTATDHVKYRLQLCEHVPFHHGITSIGGRLFILPWLTNSKTGYSGSFPPSAFRSMIIESDPSAGGVVPRAEPMALRPQPQVGFESREMVLHQDGRSRKIKAPLDHKLDLYRQQFPLYDRQLPLLSRLLSEQRPGTAIVDVGANIGDTAALCRLAGCELKIVAVEPSERFFAFLTDNIKDAPDLYRNVAPVRAFVGRPDDRLALHEHDGTARTLVGQSGLAGAIEVPTIGLTGLAAETVSLVKIDTDGYDASIIDSEIDFLQAHSPILWTEAEVGDVSGVQQWARALDRLASIYSDVCVFDNFGFALTWGPLAEKRQTIVDLVGYCQRHAKRPANTHGNPTIYYVDLAFFAPGQRALFERFTQLIA